MGQQYSSVADGPSATNSPHNAASSSPPTTRADTGDMRPSPAWGSNASAVMSSLPSRSESELGEHHILRSKTENEVARMSIRAVIDTFIENCLSANNDNSPQAEDKSSDELHVNRDSNSQSEDLNGDKNNEFPGSKSVISPEADSDCLVKAADVHSQRNSVSTESHEVIELVSEDGLGGVDSNSQVEQPVVISRNNSQVQQPDQASRDNSQTGSVSRDNIQAEQIGPVFKNTNEVEQPGHTVAPSDLSSSLPEPEKELAENSQKMLTSEHTDGSTNGTQPRTSERQTFSAYLQERLKTIDLDKHEELTQLALSKNIHCQGQMFMWEMMKKPLDDCDPGSQSMAHGGSVFPSGPVRLQTVIDRVLDKSLLNQDPPTIRGREDNIGKEALQNVSPSVSSQAAATARERVSQEIQEPPPANKTRLCFKDHIEKVLLESFLSFEEEERAEALKAEAKTNQQSVETGGNKIHASKSGNSRATVETDRLNSGNNRPPVETDRLNSGNNRPPVETDRLNSGNNRQPVEADRLNSAKSGINRSSVETDRLKSNKSLPSVETDRLSSGGNSRTSVEADSEKLSNNKEGYQQATAERDRVNIGSDGTISVQDIVDQVINQTEMISRLLTPSARDSIKLAPPTGTSSDSSLRPLGLPTQSKSGLRYQGPVQNRSLLETQRLVVHKEHHSSTVGRKRGRPRLGSPVNTSVKCMPETSKSNYQDPRGGSMTSQVSGHPHTAAPSRDYALTNHFPSGASARFSPLGSPQIMRPSAMFQQGHDKMPSAMFQQSHDKLPSAMYQQGHDKLPSAMYQQGHDKLPSAMFQQGHDKLPSAMFQQGHDKLSSAMFQQGHDKLPSAMFQQSHDKLPSTMFQQGHDMMQKSASKCLTGPASSPRQLHPHDNYHQQHGGHQFPSHPHQPQPLDGGQISNSNVHQQQNQVERIKENISSSNRLVPVSHIPIKSCSCPSCIAHFSERKSPSQIVHIQQHIHHHPFSKVDGAGDRAHLSHHQIKGTVSHMASNDFYSQTISTNKQAPSPVIPFSGQGHPASQTHKKDAVSAPSSREIAGEALGYSSGHYQAHMSQPGVKPLLFDPRFAGNQVEHFVVHEDAFQRVTKDKDIHLATMDLPKLEAGPLDASMTPETDQPLDLSVKPCPTTRSCLENGTDRPRHDTEFPVRRQPYIQTSPSLPPRSEAEFEQQPSSGHHLQSLESSVDRFLPQRHSQLHMSQYPPSPHVSLYTQGAHLSQHRPRMSQFHAPYHVRTDVQEGHLHPHHLQEHHFTEVLSRCPGSPGHTTPHQSPLTFAHSSSPATHLTPMSQPPHRQDIIESPADQYQTSVVLVDNLPRIKDVSHNPQSDYSSMNPAHSSRSLCAADYQRPPSHTPDSRPEGTPSIDAAIVSSPSRSHSSPSPEDSQKLSLCKHEPIQNIIGNHPPSDILYLICLLCRQTYGSPYGFRKHFRNQHGFEPKSDHTVIQTISATKTAMAHTGPSESTKRSLHPQVLKDEKHNEELFLHGESIKSPSGEGATVDPLQPSPDPMSSYDCKSDVLKELPAATKCLECPECGQTFQLNDFGSYKRHCRQHSLHRNSDPFACHDCERSFSEPTHLQDHLATHNSSFTPSVCGICRTFFSSPSYLATHLQTAHGVGGSDSGQKHMGIIDSKSTDSTRKCVSEPVMLADPYKFNMTNTFSDLPVMTSSSLSVCNANTSSQTAAPSASNYSSSTSSISNHGATSSAPYFNAIPSPSTQSKLSSGVKQILTRSSLTSASSITPSLPVSKHQRFASPGSHMLTVHTPKGLEIQKLPADAVVTSASPDSSYDELKLHSQSGAHTCSTENVSLKGTNKESSLEGGNNSSSLDKRKGSTDNGTKKVDNTSDSKCDNKDEAGSHSSDQFTFAKSDSVPQDSLDMPCPEASEADKFYQHKKYSRHRKRVTDSDNYASEPEPKSKCPKVTGRVVTDKADQLPIQVSSTLNSTVTVRDCESSEDSNLSWVKAGEGKR